MKLALYDASARGWFIAPADMEISEALKCRVSPFYLRKAAAERALPVKQAEYDRADADERRTRPGVFDLRRQLGRAPTAAEYRATRGR